MKDFCDEDDEEYPKIVLQIMALRQKTNPLEVKKKILVNSKVFKVEKGNWDFACNLLDKSLQRLQNTTTGYGIIRPELLPYRTIVATMSGLLEFSKSADDFNKLDAWYWSSIFTERYAGASDTAIKQDFDQVKKWFEDTTKIPEVVKTAENRIKDIDLANTSKGAISKAVMNLVASKGALDFYTGQSIELCKLNDHHVFPKKSGITLTNENSILNRTLIQESTNNDIRKKKPSEYIATARQELGSEEKLKEVMKTHFIDETSLQALKNDDYAGYLKAREAAILQEISSKIKLRETTIVPTVP